MVSDRLRRSRREPNTCLFTQTRRCQETRVRLGLETAMKAVNVDDPALPALPGCSQGGLVASEGPFHRISPQSCRSVLVQDKRSAYRRRHRLRQRHSKAKIVSKPT